MKTFNTQKEAIEEIIAYYNLGLQYISFRLNEMPINVRMNKDHSRKFEKYCNEASHNVSLINRRGNGVSEVNSYFRTESFLDETRYVQQQFWGIMDEEDLINALNEFFFNINHEN